MFQLEEGIQTECQGPSQAQEIKREVWSNDDSLCSRMSLTLTHPMGKDVLLKSLIFETGGLLFPPIYHSSNGQVMGLGETLKFVMGIGH